MIFFSSYGLLFFVRKYRYKMIHALKHFSMWQANLLVSNFVGGHLHIFEDLVTFSILHNEMDAV